MFKINIMKNKYLFSKKELEHYLSVSMGLGVLIGLVFSFLFYILFQYLIK